MNASCKREGLPDREGPPNDGIHRPNVEKLATYINGQEDPRRFAGLLLALFKPGADNFAH